MRAGGVSRIGGAMQALGRPIGPPHWAAMRRVRTDAMGSSARVA